MRHPDLDLETDDDGTDEPGPPTREALTPRGGFMARPGLKSPPRHAVVIRGGDVEPSENIPMARESHPPPPPPSEPPADSSSDKVTLRAIPTPQPAAEPVPKSELPTQLDLTPPRPLAAPVESLPPPSDMPVVASVPAPELEQAQARRRSRARLTIVLAAAAGLLLGLASVVATRGQQAQSQPAALPAAPANAAAVPLDVAPLAVEPPAPSTAAPPPSASAHSVDAEVAPADPKRLAPVEPKGKAGPKRSIF